MSADSPPNEAGTASPAPVGLDYEVIRLIGRGGYGEVWLVRDRSGGYQACKVVYRESFDHDRPYEREYAGIKKFEPVSRANESQLHILHVGRRDEAGYFYYILELADDANAGRDVEPSRYVPKTLKTDLERRGRLPLNECIHVGLALSAALEHLHRHGLIHRDIKPANIIFVNGIPKLADIGLVTDVEVSVSYVGTEGYIPPEGPTSAQADIYALGKVLYEISTGRDRLDFPELPTELGELADRQARLEFNAVVTKACQRDPGKRYQSAQELHGELALLQAGGSVRQRRAARKRGRLLAKVAAGLALVLSALAAFNYLRPRPSESVPVEPPQPVTRIAIPEAAVLARSEQEIEAECRTKLAGAGTEATARLAEELVRQSATSADTAREFAMLRVAARLANEAEVYEVTLLACDKMGLRFQAEILPVKMELLSKGTLPPRTAKGAASLAEACVATGFEAIALDEYNQAQALSALAQNAATNVTAPYLIGEALFLEHEADHCSKAYRDVKMFAETLRKNPADPGASLAVGEFLGFVKNDWEKGLPMMAHGNDERLKAVLEVELNHKPVHPRDQLAAGDLWWALAGGEAGPRKRDFQRRARYWYLKGIARSRGAEKETLKQQLAARIKAVPSPAAEVHIKSRVDATEHILLTADDIRWASSRGSLNDRISQIYVGELKPGVVRTFKNCGATRLFPEDVDFSTAQLTIDHKAKRRGRATLETGEDHVRIILADPPMGSSELEVTVSFLATSSSAASPSPAGP